MTDPDYKWPLVLIAAILIAFVAYEFMIMPGQHRASDKIANTIHDFPHDTDEAERRLDDRTSGQKRDDAIKDSGGMAGDKNER